MTAGSTETVDPVAAPQRVFIVYSRADKAWVLGYLAPSLAAAGVPLSTEEDFPPGSVWRDAATEVITGASRVILVLSKAFVTEQKLQWIEMAAQHRGLREARRLLLPIRLEPVELDLALDVLVLLDATDPERRAHVVEDICRELGRPSIAPRPPACPYPGMRAYKGEPEYPFFGRAAEIDSIVDRVDRQRRVVLIGPSGSGKSSLLLAGVLPRLQKDGWQIAVIRPVSATVASLNATLATLAHGTNNRRLLVVDQLEEVFSPEFDKAEEFIAALVDECEKGQTALALTARADFLARFMESARLWRLVGDHRVEVLPLRGKSLATAITGPAESLGVYIDPVLIERLVHDAEDEPGRMPLLQETLRLIWNDIELRFLPLHAYVGLVDGEGAEIRRGLHVALARNADAAWNTFDESDRGVARRVLIRLVQLGEGGPDVRRQLTMSALQDSDADARTVERVVAELVSARILTIGSSGPDDPDPVVDIAHEALISRWPTFARWLNEHRAAENLRRELDRSAHAWKRRGWGQSGLLDETELLEAERWLAGGDPLQVGAGPEIRRLVRASKAAVTARQVAEREARESELARQREHTEHLARSARRLRLLTAGLAALLVAAIFAGGFAVVQQRAAVTERRQARAAELAGVAASLSGPQADRAAILALAGNAIDDSTATRVGLLAALNINPRVRREVLLHGGIETVAAAHDGSLIAAGVLDGRVVLVDPDDGSTRAEIMLPAGSPRSIAFFPDDATIAVGADNGLVTRWDTETGDAAGLPLAGHSLGVRSVAISSDGRWLASGGVDARVVLRRLDGTEPDRQLIGHTDWVNALAFSPDGDTLYSGAGASEGNSQDRRILAWDLIGADSAPVVIGEHEDAVRAIAVSPDGTRVASAGADRVVRVWDPATGEQLATGSGHSERIYDVAFSLDGQRLLTASRDLTVRQWDAATGEQIGDPLRAHELAVHAIVPIAGDLAVSAGTDGRLVVWDVAAVPAPRLVETLDEFGGPVGVSGDGRLVALADADGSVVVRDVASSSAVGPGAAIGTPVQVLELDHDGTTVVAALSGRLEQWSVADGQRLASVDVPSAAKSLSVAPDGTVALGTSAGPIWLFEPGLQGEPRRLDGHRSWVTGVAFTGAGELVSVGADGEAFAWTLGDQIERRPITAGTTSQFTSVAASPVGELVVAGDTDGRLQTVDLSASDGARSDQVVIAHDAHVTTLAFSADGATVMSGDADGSVTLWAVDARVISQLGPQRDARGAVRDGYFAAESTRLVTSTSAGVWLWNHDLVDWRAELCAVAGRDLTVEERREFAPDLDEVELCPGES